jgi:hypothetical protein
MTNAIATLLSATLFSPLLAEAETSPLGWAVIGFCIILGLMVTLGPSKRTSEIKNPYDH